MDFLKKIFSKNVAEPYDFSRLKTDMHSHLIPGIDDGSKSVEESLELLKAFQSLGYKKIITTPHIMSDYYKNTPEIINKGKDLLLSAIEKNSIDIEFEAAAEYYFDEFFAAMINKKELLTFSANHVLFELPFMTPPNNLDEVIFQMQMQGYQPVLAHPERYGYWHHLKEKYHELNEKGVILQLNLLSVTGHYGPEVKKAAVYLIENQLVKLAGTDCHRMEHLQILKSQEHQKSFQWLDKASFINQDL